ncbi:MAG: hypothetical protein HY814_01360 [Candidatus Riflebacteria bacterium]|nr:hypothetical protein [Candidatus Riflebacteria bacterium]
MQPEPEFDLIRFLKALGKRGLRYLLIGRWAVAQHGAPVVTADYDFWIHPRDRSRFLALLVELFDAELPPAPLRDRPILSAFVGVDKVDCFSMDSLVSDAGERLVFDEVHARSEEKRDQEYDLVVRIPCIDDLIALKKLHRDDPLKELRDQEDIRYLTALKSSKDR